MTTIHPGSLIGWLQVKREAAETKRAAAAALSERRGAELSELEDRIDAIGPDGDLDELAGILSRKEAASLLDHLALCALEYAVQDVASIDRRLGAFRDRLARYQESVACLADPTIALPMSPALRAEKLAVERFRVGLLVGDPAKLDALRDAVRAVETYQQSLAYSAYGQGIDGAVPLDGIENELFRLAGKL